MYEYTKSICEAYIRDTIKIIFEPSVRVETCLMHQINTVNRYAQQNRKRRLRNHER